ncbi:MAG TPA: glycosyltransferase family 39 protein [Chloroflexota bacterium]|nr:glycosyltransferase family 39 protein [Chloroflexota bacterium]
MPGDKERPKRTHRLIGHVGEAAAIAALALLIGGVYLSFTQYGFDVLEEGYFLTNAWRVLQGDVPYRDFNAPYTPGIFYLYAWIFEHLGRNMVVLRTVHVVARVVFFLALYATGRRVCSPFYAALPPLFVLAIDTVPGVWSLHPGWLTTPCSILGVACVAAYLRGRRAWWLVGAGLCSGLAFAFKQNLAAYGLMAALWLLVVFERQLPPLWDGFGSGRRVGWWGVRWLLRLLRSGVQASALVLLVLVPTMIALPYMSPLVAALYLVPLGALSALGVLAIMMGLGSSPVTYGRELAFYARPLLVLVPFAGVTAAWFVPFFERVERRIELLGPIVGQIEQEGYFLGMLPPTGDHARVLVVTLVPALLLPAIARIGLWGRWGAAVLFALGAWTTIQTALDSWGQGDPWNAMDWLIELRGLARNAASVTGEGAYSTGEILLYLPSLAFWVGFALLARRWLRGWATGWGRRWSHVSGSGGLMPMWLLVAGACLLFNQYPRMDSIHLLWSGGVLFVVAAAVLERWERFSLSAAPALAAPGLGLAALRAALLILPVTAVLPTVFARVEYAGQFFRPMAAPAELTRPEGPYGLLRLNVPGDSGNVWLPGKEAQQYHEIAALLAEKTAPGEAIFAYPAVPGFYYLTNHPNPTPFNHLFPSMADDAEQQEIARALEGVRYIIWDDAGAHLWVWPGLYAPVTEYIRLNFRIERFVGQYAILSRQAVIDWGEPLYYWIPGQEPWNQPGWSG